ncbi:MAG: threonine synthase [Bacteroides sp.]|nr:threonine synthase [Bacteroides sp.]MCM1412772.1 threonine synthase [Bacteroides sp.]MCM1470934.1 threonine synthase [Bacteroides sp.]
MNYYSTTDPQHTVSLREAILRSVASDGGVYMPVAIPRIPKALFNNIADMTLQEIAYVAATSMFGSDIEAAKLNDIVKDTLSFPINLVELEKGRYSLELFHGPSGSFKDVGARFMARIVDYILTTDRRGGNVKVFVATSGDTGCAVSTGFAGFKNVDVYILHPHRRTLRVPESTFRSPAPNIHPVSIRGTFDQCQSIVRQIYRDAELNRTMNITSANSINIARLLPQTFYFYYAYARILALNPDARRIAIATPCGNLGNLTAALFAYQMGLPITRILAAGHDNERLWGTMSEGRLMVNDFNSKALTTNVARINSLFANNPSMADMIECHTFNDDQTAQQIVDTYHRYGYLMDRNTAMACRAMELGLNKGETGVFLATAAPEKYADVLRNLLGDVVSLPKHDTTAKRQHNDEPVLPPLYPAVKRYLLEHNH